MQYDFSPLHPDDFGRQQAFRWRDALACRNAFDTGMHDAAREGQAYSKVLAMEPQA